MMNHLNLFSGIGGFSLGLEATGGFRTVGFCEIEPFCQKVLRKHWPDTPIYEDVRSLNHEGTVDIITGGYPCQPFSTAGKRKGESDPRHLWPAMFELIGKHRPRWVIGENVAGHISMGLDEVLADLEREAYEAIPFVIPACAVGAPHIRERIWIIAWDTKSQRTPAQREIQGGQNADTIGTGADFTDAQHDGCYDTQKRRSPAISDDKGRMPELEGHGCAPAYVPADTESERLQGQRVTGTGSGENEGVCQGRGFTGSTDPHDHDQWRKQSESGFWREVEPPICGMDDGLSEGLDEPAKQIKALGNSVVPQIPFIIGKFILEIEKTWLTPAP